MIGGVGVLIDEEVERRLVHYFFDLFGLFMCSLPQLKRRDHQFVMGAGKQLVSSRFVHLFVVLLCQVYSPFDFFHKCFCFKVESFPKQ